MTPVKGRIKHDPANGLHGDCHRAAVATMLDLPYEAVPHFNVGGPDGPEFKFRERTFLATHGLRPIDAVYAGEEVDRAKDFPPGPGLVLYIVSMLNPGVPYLLGGRSRNGVDHTVVALDGEIVHDPGMDEPGIVGACLDGWYWVTFFGALSLDRRPRCGLCGSPLTPDGLCSRAACANSD